MKVENLTKNDIKKIEEEIKYRKLQVRPKALEDVKAARAHGDLSENFEYYAAKKFNRENNSRIEYLEKMLKNANVIEVENKSCVSLEKMVKVKYVDENIDEENWDIDIFKIVTSIRSDSLKKRISIESPLGKALIGKNVGEIATVNISNGSSYALKVISIEDANDDLDEIKQF